MATVAVRKKVVNVTKVLCSVTANFFVCIDCIENQEKNRAELYALKYSKSLTQITSYAHWHAFLYLFQNIYLFILFKKKKIELNKLSELEYLKTPSQMSSYAHWYAFVSACLNMYQNIYSFIAFEIRKKRLS